MTHHIVWEMDRDHVSARAACDDEDCISRYICDEDCTSIFDIQRHEDGTVDHGTWNDLGDELTGPRHPMYKADFCNVVEYLEADPSLIPELSEDLETFEIGRTAIEPVWQGEDGLTWRRPQPADALPEEKR